LICSGGSLEAKEDVFNCDTTGRDFENICYMPAIQACKAGCEDNSWCEVSIKLYSHVRSVLR
jgi:hypothetical protein